MTAQQRNAVVVIMLVMQTIADSKLLWEAR